MTKAYAIFMIGMMLTNWNGLCRAISLWSILLSRRTTKPVATLG